MRITGTICAAVLVVSSAAGLGCGESAEVRAARHPSDEPNRCGTCHMPDFIATKNPMHEGIKPTTCGVCHASTSWHPSHLEHPFWALTGAHERARCFDCHRGTPPVFHGTSKVCVDCHRPDFDGSKFPGHATFPLTCTECHTTTAWKPSTWKSVPTTKGQPDPSGTSGAASPHPVPPSQKSQAAAQSPEPVPTPRRTSVPRPTPMPTPKPPDVVTQPSRRGGY